jgi:hypothetical protein
MFKHLTYLSRMMDSFRYDVNTHGVCKCYPVSGICGKCSVSTVQIVLFEFIVYYQFIPEVCICIYSGLVTFNRQALPSIYFVNYSPDPKIFKIKMLYIKR